MRVQYRTRRLQRCAADETAAVRAWGPKVARSYHNRLTLLRSAPTLAALRPMRHLRLHRLKGDREGQWALDLTERWRLIVRAPVAGTVIIEEVSQHYGD